jgi:uncharacterized Fe-S cluster protein YjdI
MGFRLNSCTHAGDVLLRGETRLMTRTARPWVQTQAATG